MARNKKGSKNRKPTAGGKRKSGRAGSATKGKKKASRKPVKAAGKKARKKTATKAAKKSARRPSAKRAPAKKKSGKKASGKAKSASSRATRPPARKAGQKAGRKASTSRRAPARSGAPRPAAARTRAPSRDAAFYDHFRRKLLEQRDDITRRLDELRDELRGLEQTPRELEEWAQEEKDRDILIRLEDRETEELRKIQAALQLIDRREYGLCQICGKGIPRARLEELPTAFRCVDCTP